MYVVGRDEIDALAKVINANALFRYGVGGECDRFEARYAEYLGIEALRACGKRQQRPGGRHDRRRARTRRRGPHSRPYLHGDGDLGAWRPGAIPIIVDIDETLTIDPDAVEAAIGPRTRAVVPVHMWGTACDMDAIMEIAQRRGLIVIEDACQGVGGGYEGRKFASIGHVGCFSFNYYKNMTCGEGGGVATNDDALAERVRCAIDPCHFYWHGRSDATKPFSANGARASELMGAMLNVQLDRIDGMVEAMRARARRSSRADQVARQSRTQAGAAEQREIRLRHARPLRAAVGRSGRGLQQALSERRRRQDRPAHLHRMGPGSDGRRRGAPVDESLQHAGQRGVPADLFQGHVRPVARDPQPDRHGADASAPFCRAMSTT